MATETFAPRQELAPALDVATSRPALHLRLQAPSLAVDGHRVRAVAEPHGDEVTWVAEQGGVAMRMTWRPAGADLWHVETSLHNSSAETRDLTISWPYVVYRFAQETAVRVFDPLFGGTLEVRPHTLTIAYPGQASFCLTAAAGDEACVATGIFDDEQRHVTIRHVPAGNCGHMRMVLERASLPPGAPLTLPVMYCAVAETWPEAFRPYRDFVAAAFPRTRPRPCWLHDEGYSETRAGHCVAPQQRIGLSLHHIFDDLGGARSWESLRAEIDAIAEQGRAEGWKPLFYQFAWWEQMEEVRGVFEFDSLCGDYFSGHELARRSVEHIHALGLRVYLYTNVIAAGEEAEVYRLQPQLFARDAAGQPYYNAGLSMYMFCPGAPGIRDYWERVLQTILVDMDADGIFLDQLCGATAPMFCYDASHGHEHPDTYGRDMVALGDWIAARAKQIKPDAYVGAELVLDSRSVLVDETHGYGYSGPRPALRPPAPGEEATTPPYEHYVFTRYLCPDVHAQIGRSSADLANGAAGSFAWPVWRDNVDVFESTVTPCRVSPAGAVAYLYGPVEGRAVLAVRAPRSAGTVAIELPASLSLAGSLPDAVRADGTVLHVEAADDPSYHVLRVVSEARR